MNNILPINKVLCGDAIKHLKIFPDNHFDSIVTDLPAGISFMSKQWDGDKGGRNAWINWLSNIFIEARRVIKPGSHALVWALPRTSHWTAMALEDAGFEIRDCIYHVFGSGFPKSMDISKAIDKQAGVEREKLGTKYELLGHGHKTKGQLYHSDHDRKWLDNPDADAHFVTTPASLEAKQWSGWGTALKPAVECWWLVRKPLSEKTVAENVLKWGVGGLNIDGCRIEANDQDMLDAAVKRMTGNPKNNGAFQQSKLIIPKSAQGRFPANLIHDGSEEVLVEFAKAGNNKGAFASVKSGQDGKSNGIYGDFAEKGDDGESYYNDTGTAARFFYCAKPSRSERDNGLTQSIGIKRETPMAGRGQGGLKCEICGKWKNSGSPCTCPNPKFVEVKFDSKPNKNNHPTVKSQALMQYLIKLITPPNSIGLDMFAGSGSTLIAYKKLGHRYVGIEIDPDYCKIAEQRLIADLNGNRSLDAYASITEQQTDESA